MQSASSIPALLQRTARDPAIRARVAIRTATESATYAELTQRIERMAGSLIAGGLKRGERVGVLAGRSIDAVAGLFGIMAAGGAACVLDTHAATADLKVRARVAGLSWLLADSAHATAASDINIHKTRYLPDVAQGAPDFMGDLSAADDALLLFTSGSSGTPKAVLLTHGNLVHHAHAMNEHTRMAPDDHLLHVMPFHHTNGINNQLIAPFACGAAVTLLERFRAESFFADVARYRPTYITAVPTMYSRLLEHAAPPDLASHVRLARCGSAPISESLHRAVEAHLGIPLVISYGLSEATCASTMNPLDARRIGTVGIAIPGVTLAILAPRTGDAVAPGAEGEVCIAGPTIMKGYTSSAAGGLEVDRGWLRTGDLGKLDRDGYLCLTGRLKDLIIRGGANLSPAAIEAALLEHPSVHSCCVVGAPDADLGEVPVAFLVARDGHAPDDKTLREAVEKRLSRAHVPQRFVVLDALPEIGVGKTNRQALKDRAARS